MIEKVYGVEEKQANFNLKKLAEIEKTLSKQLMNNGGSHTIRTIQFHLKVSDSLLSLILGNDGSIRTKWAAEETFFDTPTNDLRKNNMFLRKRGYLAPHTHRVDRVEYELQVMDPRLSNSVQRLNDNILCYTPYTEISQISLKLAEIGVQWNSSEHDHPIDAGLVLTAALLTNRLVVEGNENFHLDMCNVIVAKNARKMLSVGCIKHVCEFLQTLAAGVDISAVLHLSSSKLSLLNEECFDDSAKIKFAYSCQGFVQVDDLQKWDESDEESEGEFEQASDQDFDVKT